MASTDQKRRLLKAKIAVALHDELGRVPKEDEVNQVFFLTRVKPTLRRSRGEDASIRYSFSMVRAAQAFITPLAPSPV